MAKHDDLIQARQTKILEEIAEFEHGSADDPKIMDCIRHLQAQYNSIVDERLDLTSSSLLSPLDALPLEVWIKIIKVVVEESSESCVDTLLLLTAVSNRWRQALVSLCLLWTTIELIPGVDDLLAKLAISLHLSQSCQLNIYIMIPTDIWQEVSSMIIAESGRICHLYIQHPSDTLRIFQDFSSLPILGTLELLPSVTLDASILDSIKLDEMPLLRSLNGYRPPFETDSWRRFITQDELHVPIVQQEDLETRAMLPNLHTMAIIESHSEDLEEIDIPTSFDGCLASITTFGYAGPFPCRALRWVGPSLTHIERINISQFEDHQLFSQLEQFSCLYALSLVLDSDDNYGPLIASMGLLGTITELTLIFRGIFPRSQAVLDDQGFFYETLITCLPSVQDLCIRSGTLTGKAFHYIGSLGGLKTLALEESDINLTGMAFSSSELSLRSIHCHSERNLTHYLACTIAPNLEVLNIGVEEYIEKYDEVNEAETMAESASSVGEGSSIDIPRIKILGELHPCVIYLTIVVGDPVFWHLEPSFTLRELEIQATIMTEPSLPCASDVLEAILMRPRAFPALDTITLRGNFLEWDILIILLERRNVSHSHGINPIKTIIVDADLPYCLMEPISTLLQGKFPKKKTYASFSIEKIGERMWNKDFTGCEQCCCTFRACNSPVINGRSWSRHYENEILGWKYPFPSELLAADPPLTPDIARWLSGKHARRISYLRSYDETNEDLLRISSCSASGDGDRSYSNVVITKDSLKDRLEALSRGSNEDI